MARKAAGSSVAAMTTTVDDPVNRVRMAFESRGENLLVDVWLGTARGDREAAQPAIGRIPMTMSPDRMRETGGAAEELPVDDKEQPMSSISA